MNTDGKKINMKKTINRNEIIGDRDRLTVNTDTLAAMLDCGRSTAVKIGTEAGAKIKVGSRTLFRVPVIERYLDERTRSGS